MLDAIRSFRRLAGGSVVALSVLLTSTAFAQNATRPGATRPALTPAETSQLAMLGCAADPMNARRMICSNPSSQMSCFVFKSAGKVDDCALAPQKPELNAMDVSVLKQAGCWVDTANARRYFCFASSAGVCQMFKSQGKVDDCAVSVKGLSKLQLSNLQMAGCTENKPNDLRNFSCSNANGHMLCMQLKTSEFVDSCTLVKPSVSMDEIAKLNTQGCTLDPMNSRNVFCPGYALCLQLKNQGKVDVCALP
jgi:hypothetical protein